MRQRRDAIVRHPNLLPLKSTAVRATVTLLWALVVGLLLGLGAYLSEFPVFAVVLVAVLGGMGSAAFVLAFIPGESDPADSVLPGS